MPNKPSYFATTQISPTEGGGGRRGIEPVRTTLSDIGLHTVGDHKPLINWPIIHQIWERLRNTSPGDAVQADRDQADRIDYSPSPIRAGIRTVQERRDTILTGSPYYRAGDEQQTGVEIEPANRNGLVTPRLNISDARRLGDKKIRNEPAGGLTDSVTEQIQSLDSETSESLASLRASFPSQKVMQFPARARAILLTGNVAQDLVLPDGTVLARFTWTAPGTNDLWMGLSGAAFIPTANLNNLTINDQQALNPDSAAYYYVKDKKQISFICANACTVVATCYMQN